MTHLHTSDIQQRYNGEIGRQHLQSEFFRETLLMIGRMRRKVFSKAQGSILDVACGAGENFRYYQRPGSQYTAIDLSAFMIEQARERAEQLRMTVDLQVMDAQQLQFDDHSFDTVVSALSTCTFPDPVTALREMRRVCKPEGRILLLEHGRSSVEFLGRWLDRIAPAQYAETGCRINQDPRQTVEQAGLKIVWIERRLLGLGYMMEVK
jgi:ubiquinone/menaquinone biosynthesis C-methylase UbiE